MRKIDVFRLLLGLFLLGPVGSLYSQEDADEIKTDDVEAEEKDERPKDYVDSLIENLASRNRETRLFAVQELGKLNDPRMIEPLVKKALKDAQSSIRDAATEILLKIHDMEVRDLLLDALQNEKPHIQGRAAAMLGKKKERDARKILEDVMEDVKGREWTVRKKAATALGEIGDERSITVLLRGLNDKDGRIRYGALEAANKFEDKRVERPTMLALKDEDPQVRGLAAQILSIRKSRESVGYLVDAVKREEERQPRSIMFDALRIITGEKMRDDLEAWEDWYRKNKGDWR